MEIPLGTVMTHLARGRKKLREDLAEYASKMGTIREFPGARRRKDSLNRTEEKGSGTSP